MTAELFLFSTNHSFIHIRMTLYGLSNLLTIMHSLLGVTHLTINLESAMYFDNPSVLSGVTTKKVFNRDSIPNESNVPCEGYGLLGALGELTIVNTLSHTIHRFFSKSLHQT